MKRLAGFVAVILATLTVVVLLWQFRAVAVLFIFSLVVGAAVGPVIDYLTERGIPRGLAMALTYLLVLGTIGGLLYFAVAHLVGELQQAGDAFAAAYEKFKTQPASGGALGLLAERLPALNALYEVVPRARATTLATNALGFTVGFFDWASKVVIVLVLSIYWGSDRVHFERLWLSLLPAEQRSRARSIWRSIETGVGAYVRSETAQGLLAGVVLGIGFWAIGLPYPVLMAFIGAIAWFIPLLGGAAALVVVTLTGLSQSLGLAVAAFTFTLAVLVTLEFVVERRLFDRRRYNPILTVVVIVALTDALGVFGLLVAPPLAAAIQILFRELTAQPPVTEAIPHEAVPELNQIKDRLAAAKASLAELEGQPPELVSLMQKLECLVERASDQVETEKAATQASGAPRAAKRRVRAERGA